MRLALVIIAASLILFGVQSRSETALERGRYLVDTIASCGNCHTPKGPNGPLPGKKLAGGDVIKHQDFTAVVPNITSDQETGIGKWTDDEISLAIREGKRPDGTLIGPAMPSRSYRNLGDEDVRAIVAYLRAVPAVHNPITAKSQYDAIFPASWGPPVGHVNAPPKEDRIAYGAYLAGPLARCMDCHTDQHKGQRLSSAPAAKPSMAHGVFRSRPILPPTGQTASAIGRMPRSSAQFALASRATVTNCSRRCHLPLMHKLPRTTWRH